MVIDALGLVSNAQQVTSDTTSTSSVDQGNVTPKREIGTGEPVGFGVVITAAGTNTGSLIISVIESAADTLGTPTKLNARALITAQLAAGSAYFIAIPPGAPILRYLGLDYDVTGTVDVTLKAFLTTQSGWAEYQHYAKGFTVS